MRIFIRVLLALALWLPATATPAHALTVDEILSKYATAKGGDAKIHALKSLRLSGKLTFGQGDNTTDVAFGVLYKRNGMLRQELTIQGLTQIEAFDGKEGWRLQPFGGRREPERETADEVKALAQQADLDGPLIDSKDKGHKIEYLGTEDIDGTLALKVRVNRKDGDTQYYYLDPDAFVEIRVESVNHIRGVEQVSQVDYGSYEQVNGVWIPFALEAGQKGGPRNVRINIEKAEPNVEVDDGVFRFPADPKAVTRVVLPGTGAGATPGASQPAPLGGPPTVDQGVISGLGARNIGSATMSGRIAAVAGLAKNGTTLLYVGAASGGVWKSMDGGTTFKPVFDKQPVQSIGSITIDPTDEKTVWVGTGESWTRNSVSIGNGIYKSTDGGETWTNMGLGESERIVRILVNPKNHDVVFACAPGKLWSDSSDRGLYKTSDGGKTWNLVLKGANASTGCSSVTMDPKNPDVLFAGMWDFRRKGWTFRSGGDGAEAQSGSGLYASTDGGATWKPLAAQTRKGLPQAPWGRVEVVVAPSDSKIVYALIESKDSALFRSADGGQTWEQRDKSQMMVWRPFYFGRLIVDPTNADRLFKPCGGLIASDDGGKTFTGAGGSSHGDWHDIWIDPSNTKHVIGGDDGGLWISYDGGSRWWKGNNLPISQFYHVAVDNKDPYQVYGGLQDNASWVGDSAYAGGISNSRWEMVGPGCDGFYVIPDPTDPDGVYGECQGGYMGRLDRKTRAVRDLQPKASYKEKLRFNWNTPIYASPTQKGTIYIGAQFLFRSKDKGVTWERISPDLTSNDPEKQKQELSGGVTVDNSSAEMHTTIYSISESPKDARTLWVGTDDGNLQLSRDAGKTWKNVGENVPGLPRASWVSWVEASRFDAGTAYAAFDRHSFGDMTPWVFKTSDYGKTWTRIVGPEKGVRGYAHVIKEDTVARSLLFVGTELGLWISLDAGTTWAEFKGGNFPSVAVRDLQVQPRENDLVLATHGRGIWIIDDISPLRALTADVLAKNAAFLPGRQVQQRMPGSGGWVEGDAAFVGENPPGGAVITYYQRGRHLFGGIKMEILDDKGKVVDTVSPSKRRGINRVSWSMRLKPPRVPRAAQVAFNATQGPRVAPGTYTVRLSKGSDVVETKLTIAVDRRAPYGAVERKAQLDAALRVSALFEDMSALVDRIDAARTAARARAAGLPAKDALAGKLGNLADHLDEVKKAIVATKEGGAITGEERIREHLDILYGAIATWEGRPAKYQLDRIDALKKELDDVHREFETVATRDVGPLNEELRQHKLEPIPTKVAVEEGNPETLAEAAECLRTQGLRCEEKKELPAERD